MKSLRFASFVALFAFIASGICSAQSTAPYTEGSVWHVTMVKVKPGLGDEYLKSLRLTYSNFYDEAKKQGLIKDYKILLGDAATKDDFDILLLEEYENMAAFDGQREKFDPLQEKTFGGPEKQLQMAMKRLDVREIRGSKLMRQVVLK